MKDRKTQSDDWIGEWIARQREALAQTSNQQEQTTQANPAELLRRWFEAGQERSAEGGQKTFAEGGPLPGQGAAPETQPFADPFNIGGALLGAWASAGLFRSTLAQQSSDVLGRLPPLGLAREQTEAWRELAAAQAHCQQVETELRSVLVKVQFDALDLLSERVSERGESDPIDSFRALYDLWVECGEQVYSKLAHSESYAKLQAELGNATMRLRARMQTVIEHGLKQFDLPTRSELNSLHRQIRDLRNELQRTRPAQRTPTKKRAVRKPPPKRSAKARRR